MSKYWLVIILGIAREKNKTRSSGFGPAPTERGETRWFTKLLWRNSHNGSLRILEVGDKQFQEN